jgi:6,7-dimethyl-8-ribityllumazine synthase
MGSAGNLPDDFSAGDLKIAIVASRYNDNIVTGLIDGARSAWRKRGGGDSALRLERVPGAFELPLAARALALSGKLDAIVALGCVIRGETAHFDYIAAECASGLQRVMLDTGKPISFGVLTVDTLAQALQRAAADSSNKGAEALETALAMATLLRRVK